MILVATSGCMLELSAVCRKLELTVVSKYLSLWLDISRNYTTEFSFDILFII